MRRIVTLFIAAVFLAAMMLVMAMPAFAFKGGHPGCKPGSTGAKASHGKCVKVKNGGNNGGDNGDNGDDGED